ncbi:Uncharacterised protein [Vibrio cholerae]|nr:Uncharacterised protein [Vibrio cholerae]
MRSLSQINIRHARKTVRITFDHLAQRPIGTIPFLDLRFEIFPQHRIVQ